MTILLRTLLLQLLKVIELKWTMDLVWVKKCSNNRGELIVLLSWWNLNGGNGGGNNGIDSIYFHLVLTQFISFFDTDSSGTFITEQLDTTAKCIEILTSWYHIVWLVDDTTNGTVKHLCKWSRN